MCSHNATSGAWRDVPQMGIGSCISATTCFFAQHCPVWHSDTPIRCFKCPRSGPAILASPKMSLDANARNRRPPRRVRSRSNQMPDRQPRARLRKLVRRSRCASTVSLTLHGAPAVRYITCMRRYERSARGTGRGAVRGSTCLVASTVSLSYAQVYSRERSRSTQCTKPCRMLGTAVPSFISAACYNLVQVGFHAKGLAAIAPPPPAQSC